MEVLVKDARAFLLARSRQFLEDFIDLISGPKRFLATATVYNSENLARAFSFFVILAVLVNAVSVYFLPAGEGYGRVIVFLVAYAVLFFGFTLVVLQVSWLIVGARPSLRRIMLGFLYYAGIGAILQLFLIIAVFMILHPLSETIAVLVELDKIPQEDVVALDTFFQENPQILVQGTSIFLAFLVYVLLDLVWTIVVWGAFRALADVGRWRSCAAFVIFLVMGWIIFPLSIEFLTVFLPGVGELPA